MGSSARMMARKAARRRQPVEGVSEVVLQATAPEDGRLVALTQEGDLAAFNTLVETYQGQVYNLCWRMLGLRQAAEDATQEAFVRVLRYRRKLADVKDQRAWLARIAWRVAVERRRKMPRVSQEVALEEVSEGVAQMRASGPPADQAVLASELAELTGKLIATLPEELRDAITLSTVEELAMADVARMLDVNEAAVRSRIFRARQILREKLTSLLGTL